MKRKRPKHLGQPFVEWSPERADLGPFMDLDGLCKRLEIFPSEFPAKKPWIVEADGEIKAPWGSSMTLEQKLPAAVRAAAQRCLGVNPWKTLLDDTQSLRETIENPDYDSCSTRFEQIKRYRYYVGALDAAAGRSPGMAFGAERDFLNRCIRKRIDRGPEFEDELPIELDGPALDQRAADVGRTVALIRAMDEEIDTAPRFGFPARAACANLATHIFEEAERYGAYQAEKGGPNEPIPTEPHLTEDLKTLPMCLRESPVERGDAGSEFDIGVRDRFTRVMEEITTPSIPYVEPERTRLRPPQRRSPAEVAREEAAERANLERRATVGGRPVPRDIPLPALRDLVRQREAAEYRRRRAAGELPPEDAAESLRRFEAGETDERFRREDDDGEIRGTTRRPHRKRKKATTKRRR